MTEFSKYRCEACNWVGLENELVTAPSPFRSDDILVACPKCRMTEGFTELCDVDGCVAEATCGTPTLNGFFDPEAYARGSFVPDGYTRTCGKHIPQRENIK